MKQSNQDYTNGIEELASRARSLCVQGQIGRAAAILSSEGLAPNSRATLKVVEELHPKEEPPILLQPDTVASSAYQFSDNIVFEQLKTFSKYTQLVLPRCIQSISCTQ